MKKKSIILPEFRYAKAPSEDIILNTELEHTQIPIINDDRNIVLDINELFNSERNNSIRYKLYGKVKMIFRNIYSGNTNYEYLMDRLYLTGDGSGSDFDGYLPYNEFAFIRNDVIRDDIIQPDVLSLTGFTGFTTATSGSTEHNIITTINAPYFNWGFYLSYVYDQDLNYPMKYTLSGETEPLSFVSGDGIPFRINDLGNKYELISPIEHGMNMGEYAIIDDYLYSIDSLGNENYDSEKYVINILKSQIPSGVTIFTGSTIIAKRCIDKDNITGTTSSYYVHKLKTLTNIEDCIIDKIGFESPIWEDEKKLLFQNKSGIKDYLVERNRMESIIYDFNPFYLSGITNNLDYLPTDIYISIIFKNSNGYFYYPPKVGFKFNFHNYWIDEHFSGITSNETSLTYSAFTISGTTFYSGNSVSPGTELTGSFVEYIPTEMRERIISNSFYKIVNPLNILDYGQTGDTSGYTINFSGATEDNPFGLFYQPHYQIKLRELSPYVETSNSLEMDNLPQNAKYFTDEKLWKWRDLYDHGYIDDEGYGTEHPFINGSHYIKTDINLYLRNEVIYLNKPVVVSDFDTRTDKDNINC